MTICKFENPESEDGTKHLSTMNKRVQLYLTKGMLLILLSFCSVSLSTCF